MSLPDITLDESALMDPSLLRPPSMSLLVGESKTSRVRWIDVAYHGAVSFVGIVLVAYCTTMIVQTILQSGIHLDLAGLYSLLTVANTMGFFLTVFGIKRTLYLIQKKIETP